jgi:hypothetical protein
LNKMRLSLFTDTDTSEEPKTTDSTNKDELWHRCVIDSTLCVNVSGWWINYLIIVIILAVSIGWCKDFKFTR